MLSSQSTKHIVIYGVPELYTNKYVHLSVANSHAFYNELQKAHPRASKHPCPECDAVVEKWMKIQRATDLAVKVLTT